MRLKLIEKFSPKEREVVFLEMLRTIDKVAKKYDLRDEDIFMILGSITGILGALAFQPFWVSEDILDRVRESEE